MKDAKKIKYHKNNMLVFATGNPHKVKEVNELLDGKMNIVSLKSIGITEDIPETSPTLEGNALQKARYIFEKYGFNCFSEDTGLEINALDSDPGVNTARYSGPERDPVKNMNLVLRNLKKKEDRSARFKTVIALIIEGREYTFEGIVNGTIAHQKSGKKGFGYDPIFIPENETITFAEMGSPAKNAISHRARALAKLKAFLENLRKV